MGVDETLQFLRFLLAQLPPTHEGSQKSRQGAAEGPVNKVSCGLIVHNFPWSQYRDGATFVFQQALFAQLLQNCVGSVNAAS